MPSPESKPTVYAQPYADSKDPTTRGHITGGWTESDKVTMTWGEGKEPTITRRLRGPNGEILNVNEADHARLQSAMGNLATAAAARHEADDLVASAPSAADQISKNGIISEVPGGHSRTPEVKIPMVVANESAQPEPAVSSVEQPSIPRSLSEQLDIASIRERARAGTFDQAVLAMGLYRAIDTLLQREPSVQHADHLSQIKNNLLAISAMGRDPRTAQGMGGALLGQLNNVDRLQ